VKIHSYPLHLHRRHLRRPILCSLDFHHCYLVQQCQHHLIVKIYQREKRHHLIPQQHLLSQRHLIGG